jgi:hypothetical protein
MLCVVLLLVWCGGAQVVANRAARFGVVWCGVVPYGGAVSVSGGAVCVFLREGVADVVCLCVTV